MRLADRGVKSIREAAANHEWWPIPGDVAAKQSTGFYTRGFTNVLESVGSDS